MRLPVPARRAGFRIAYLLLRVYWLVVGPQVRGVKCVLTDPDGHRILLVRHTYGPDEWELPGGALKSGESATAAAQREMEEELGVEIEQWTELGDIFGHVRRRHDVLHCVRATVQEAAITIEPGEIQEARMFSADTLPSNLGRYVLRILRSAGF